VFGWIIIENFEVVHFGFFIRTIKKNKILNIKLNYPQIVSPVR
jgi:hypothetical protein